MKRTHKLTKKERELVNKTIEQKNEAAFERLRIFNQALKKSGLVQGNDGAEK